MTAPVFTGEQVGCLAHAALSLVGIGRVAAVFSRSFYIVTDAGGWACIGSRALDPGPLNLRCGKYQQSLADQLQTASLVRLGAGSFTVEGAGRFLFHQARRWVPPTPPPWTNDSVRGGLRALDDVANPPAEGFGRLMLEGAGSSVNQNDPIGLRACESAVALDGIILSLFRQEEVSGVEVLDRLIGLGPGLTPSGDDYLAGMLVALGVLRETSARDALWQVICRRMATLTSEVSCAHLRAAAAGALSNSVHLLFNSILAGASEQLPARLAAIGAIGHTSGWDASAGAVRVLRLWLDSDGYVP
jgi:hypothetical protein